MDTNRFLVYVLGGLCGMLVVAIAVLSGLGHDPPLALTASLSASLGALLALAHPPSRGE